MNERIKIGIVGTGAIAKGLIKLLHKSSEFIVSGVLTRRTGYLEGVELSKEKIYHVPEILFLKSDVLVVSTGDPVYNTEIINEAFKYKLPVVTMDADTMVTTGSWLSTKGVITEGNGDQPGCLATLRNEILEMGFKPLVFGNIKGFLNHNPKPEDMKYWAAKQGWSVESVTSFTDGTKLQIEQTLVGNAFGADIAKNGLIGLPTEEFITSGFELAEVAEQMGRSITDYIISRTAPPGVFIVSRHEENLKNELRSYKMGDGPFYHHYKPYHLCFFEIPGTIKQLLKENQILMDNSKEPSISVAAIAKKPLLKGDYIKKGIGSFECRGSCVRIKEEPDHVPIGLLQNARIRENIDEGQLIKFSDIEIPHSLSTRAWFDTIKNLKSFEEL